MVTLVEFAHAFSHRTHKRRTQAGSLLGLGREQLHVEHEVGVRGDDAAGTARTIAELWAAEQGSAAKGEESS